MPAKFTIPVYKIQTVPNSINAIMGEGDWQGRTDQGGETKDDDTIVNHEESHPSDWRHTGEDTPTYAQAVRIRE
jgi:hypothetical protein